MFFPNAAPETQSLNAFLTFGIAFLARPVGSLLFGHFGDRIGRKATLVASMLVMGLSTTLIGLLPGYAQAGVLAPWLLCLLRFGQGVGLGGEWGGAALLATENAPPGRRAWFGMFPQLGPPIGFLIANGLFLLLLLGLGEAAFVAWAWRIPFLLSAVLVAIGLYFRVSISETPAFRAAMARASASRFRSAKSLRAIGRRCCKARSRSLSATRCSTFRRFRARLRRHAAAHSAPRRSSRCCARCGLHGDHVADLRPLADRIGRKPVLLAASALAAIVGLRSPRCCRRRRHDADLPLPRAWVMGLTFAPLGALLPELFPDQRRLYRRLRRLFARRHSGGLARADAGATTPAMGRSLLRRLLHRRRRRAELCEFADDQGAAMTITASPHPALRATFSRKREKGPPPLLLAGEGWGEGGDAHSLTARAAPHPARADRAEKRVTRRSAPRPATATGTIGGGFLRTG